MLDLLEKQKPMVKIPKMVTGKQWIATNFLWKSSAEIIKKSNKYTHIIEEYHNEKF